MTDMMQFAIAVGMVGIVLAVGVIVLQNFMAPEFFNDLCSKNGTISDVYYDNVTGKCVMTKCMQLLDKEQCSYELNLTAI